MPPEVVLIRPTSAIVLSVLLTLSSLAFAAPAAAAGAVDAGKLLGDAVAPNCEQIFYGPDIDSGVCHDLGASCKVWLYNRYGADTCLVDTGAIVAPGPVCQQLFVGPDIDQGVCVDLRGDCTVWYYDTYGTGGGSRCYVKSVTTNGALSCIMLYEIADVSRHYLCVDPKADCPVYTKTVGWSGTTTQCVLPTSAPTSSDCGAACVEECSATVGTLWVRAGCTVAHTPHYVDTGCLGSNCRFVVASCSTESSCVGESPTSFAHCQAIVTGFELDTYVCVDADAECKAWIDYRWTPYCLTQFST